VVLDVDNQEDSLCLQLLKRPLGQEVKDLGRDALATGGTRNDVAELKLTCSSIDRGQPEADEPTAVIDSGKALPGPLSAASRVLADPAARVFLRWRVRYPSEAQDLRIIDEICDVITPLFIERLEANVIPPQAAGLLAGWPDQTSIVGWREAETAV
jgi:hypothetical protein